MIETIWSFKNNYVFSEKNLPCSIRMDTVELVDNCDCDF